MPNVIIKYFDRYLANKNLIDDLVALNPVSAFAAGLREELPAW
jgi:hypothetical protein